MTFKLGMRQVGFAGFIAAVLMATQRIDLDQAAAALQRPVTELLSAETPAATPEATPAKATDPVESIDTPIAALQVLAEPTLPDPINDPVDQPVIDEGAAQIIDTVAEQVAEAVKLGLGPAPEPAPMITSAEPAAEDTITSASKLEDVIETAPLEDPAYAGDQQGQAVPDLVIDPLSPQRVVQLLHDGDMALWIKANTGQVVWFVPQNKAPVLSLSSYFQAGQLVSDPIGAGLKIQHEGGGRLREIPLQQGNGILPLFYLEALAHQHIGAVSITAAGLRVSPQFDTRIIDAQLRALSDIEAISGAAASTQPRMHMQGCWDQTGAFTIASVIETQSGRRLLSGPKCKT